MAADDSTVLSYFDSLLRKSDVKLLSEGNWLNDNVIGFVFEYFETATYSNFASDVSLIAPGVTQFIKLAEGAELDIFLEPLGLASRRLVFLVVNNHAAADVAGGSHWSLLMYDRHKGSFRHYDSSSGFNQAAAQEIADKVRPYVKANTCPVIEEDCPQQTNGSDCGVYVLCVLEHLLNEHLMNDSQHDLKAAVTPQSVTRRRHQLRQLIDHLALQKKDGS